MPWIRRHRKASRWKALRSIRTVVLLLLFAVIGSGLALMIANALSSLTGPESGTQTIPPRQQAVIEKYQNKYGADWQDKLIKKYLERMKH